MSVTTVLGQITREALGITLSHEHIFINLLNEFTTPSDPEKRRLSEEHISLENYGLLRIVLTRSRSVAKIPPAYPRSALLI